MGALTGQVLAINEASVVAIVDATTLDDIKPVAQAILDENPTT